jgi:hypothetical protein
MYHSKRLQNFLNEQTALLQKEILKYKWLESEKAGRDIGLERAYREWMDKHFGDWRRHHWQEALDDAVKAVNGLN